MIDIDYLVVALAILAVLISWAAISLYFYKLGLARGFKAGAKCQRLFDSRKNREDFWDQFPNGQSRN
jgi:hypothetical protein